MKEKLYKVCRVCAHCGGKLIILSRTGSARCTQVAYEIVMKCKKCGGIYAAEFVEVK